MEFPLAADVELEFFRQIWEKSSDPFWLCECVGDDFILAAINPAELKVDARLTPGVSLRAYLGHGPAGDELLSGYYECRDSARTTVFRQQPFVGGEERLFHTLLVPVTDAQGTVTHICGTARDLTQFLRSQRALEDLNRRLEARVAERTQALNQVNAELLEANRVLERLASSDSLTDLANRRHFFEQASAEVLRARRYAHPLSLQMLDIDHFKAINDRFGHVAGDRVLRSLADILRANLRSNDLAARLGGEEFAVLLPETSIDDALIQAERLRQSVAAHAMSFGGKDLAITVSIGVAALDPGDSSIEAVLMRADTGLYLAKQDGRDCVRVVGSGRRGASLSLF